MFMLSIMLDCGYDAFLSSSVSLAPFSFVVSLFSRPLLPVMQLPLGFPARTAVRQGRHAWLQAWPPEHVPPYLAHQDSGEKVKLVVPGFSFHSLIQDGVPWVKAAQGRSGNRLVSSALCLHFVYTA